MEQYQEDNRHTSKVYKRSFPSGRILGAHSSVNLHQMAEKSVEEKIFDSVDIQSNDFDGYVLRENPKKSCKFSASVQETAVKCGFCGKEFKSRSSLNAHLRHHSGKETNRFCCHLCWKRFKSVMSLAGHMKVHSTKYKISGKQGDGLIVATLSDTETMNLVRRKRSKRVRYNFSPYPDVPKLNDSLCEVGINPDEEDVVESLLMLSRGRGKGCLLNSEYDSLESSLVSSENVSLSEAGDGGSYGDKPREKLLDSFDEVACNNGRMISREVEVEDASEFVLWNNEKQMGFHNETRTYVTGAEPKEDMMEEIGVDVVELGFVKPASSSKGEFIPLDAHLEKGSSRKMVNASLGFEANDGLFKKCKFTCKICNRSFPTYQSLGGHQTSHRDRKGLASIKTENYRHDTKANSSIDKEAAQWTHKLQSTDHNIGEETSEVKLESCELPMIKEHRCLICCKDFVSGQALGGHKRAHFSKSKGEHVAPIEHEGSDVCNVVNANLPNLLDAEANCGTNSNSWWPGSSCDHEGLDGISFTAN